MIAILQRVTEASVTVENNVISRCGKGFLILLGVARGDTEHDAQLLADKIAKMRVFKDAEGKTNLALSDVNGGVLVVPNFTLLAAYRRGNRPDFFASEEPDRAKYLFDYFCAVMENHALPVSRGVFGAEMQVSLINDGPLTIPMDSAVLKGPKKG